MKKLIFMLISLTVLVFGCMTTANALTMYGDFYYELQEDNTVIITGSAYYITVANIPSSIEGYPVTAIDSMAFYMNEQLTTVTIPSSVTTIGKDAFSYCFALTSVTFSEGLINIEPMAFCGCAITEITFPSTLTTIGSSAFAWCPISNVYIPASVTTLGSKVFSRTSLVSLTYVGHENTWVENNCVIIDGVLDSYVGSDSNVVIPTGVTSIGSYAFSNLDTIVSVTIPDTVTSIGNWAFNDCDSLASITIPSSVECIEYCAFIYCSALSTVIIQEGTTEIGTNAFKGCTALTSITIPASVTSIAEDSFATCKALTDIYFAGTYAQWSKLNPNNELMTGFDMFVGNFSISPNVHYDSVIPTVTTTTTTTVEETVAVNTAAATASSVYVDGVITAFEAYNIADNNYFKLRDIAQILSGTEAQFEVTWDGDKQAINLVSGEVYTAVGGELATGDGTAKSYTANTSTIYLNGEEVSLTAYTINDNNYFKLRDLGEALGFNVSWDSDAQSIVIASDEAYTAD